MVTLDKIPFKLIARSPIIQNELILTEFYSSVNELKYQHKPQLRIKENNTLSLKLLSNPGDRDARLYMDGFDGTSNYALNHEDGTYLESSTFWTKVFDYGDFPLPPGLYVLCVVCNGERYYTGFEILPNALEDKNIWELMLQDVLENIPTQAVDYAYIKRRASEFACNEVTPNMLWKIIVLNNAFSKVVAALSDIASNPHNKLRKQYVLGNQNHYAAEDAKTMKLNTTSYFKENKMYVMEKTLSYDKPENRFLKKILIHLDKMILDCLREATIDCKAMLFDVSNPFSEKEKRSVEYKRKQKAILTLQDYCERVYKLQNAIRMLLHVDWIEGVKGALEENLSSQSFSDPRYNVIYRLYADLKRISNDYDSEKQFTMIWKRTSRLYEYWSLINVINALKTIGYSIENSNDAVELTDKIVLKRIYESMCLTFKNIEKNIMIKVYYDKTIPGESSGTNKESQPIYSFGKHRKPDCIMDFYAMDQDGNPVDYKGALIIDFKYRKISSFWDAQNQFKDSYSSYSCNHQFLSYKNDIRTNCFGLHTGLGDNTSSNRIKPVHEVWGLYPDVGNPSNLYNASGLNIVLLSLVPGASNLLAKRLEGFIAYRILM